MVSVFALLLCFSNLGTTYAKEQSISIQAYMDELKTTAHENGIECELINYDPSIELTRDMLENAKKEMESYSRSIRTSDVDKVLTIYVM